MGAISNMLRVTCNKCKAKLNRAGALVFGYPDINSYCKKYHLCRDCYEDLVEWLKQ